MQIQHTSLEEKNKTKSKNPNTNIWAALSEQPQGKIQLCTTHQHQGKTVL